MENFVLWVGSIGAICIGIMALSVFFTALAAVNSRLAPARYVKLKGFLKGAEVVDVHLTSGKVMEALSFVGFMDAASSKGGLPYQLQNMVVFETPDHRRVMLRSDLIKIIETRSAGENRSPEGEMPAAPES